MLGYIYKFTNITNGKSYIGQTINIEYRYKRHMRDSKTKSTKFYNSIRKNGIENFNFQIIFIVLDATHLNEFEQLFIKEYDSFYNGYNSNLGGGSDFGFKHSEETILKMRVSKLLFNPTKGKPLSEQHKLKMSKSLSGVLNPFYGKTHTDSARQKIAEANRGRKLSDEHKKIISKCNSGEGNPMYGLKRPEVGSKNKEIKGYKLEYRGVIYNSMRELASVINKSRNTLSKMIASGEIKHLDLDKFILDNTPLISGEPTNASI